MIYQDPWHKTFQKKLKYSQNTLTCYIFPILLHYRWLAEVWTLTGTPAIATVVLGIMAAFAALIIRLEVLVEMMSIGKNFFIPLNILS